MRVLFFVLVFPSFFKGWGGGGGGSGGGCSSGGVGGGGGGVWVCVCVCVCVCGGGGSIYPDLFHSVSNTSQTKNTKTIFMLLEAKMPIKSS